MLKKFDIKPFLMEKGERVGMYVASALAGLLVVLGVLKALGAGSAASNAEKLNKRLTDLEDAQRRASPKKDDLPPDDGSAQSSATYKNVAIAGAEYPNHPLYWSYPTIDAKRQLPTIFTADEAVVEVVRTKHYALVLDYDDRHVPNKITVVKMSSTTPGGGVLGAMGASGALGAMGAMGGQAGLPPTFAGMGGADWQKNMTRMMTQNRGVTGALGVTGAPGAAGAAGARGGLVRAPIRQRSLVKKVSEGNKLETIPVGQNLAPDQKLAYRIEPRRTGIILATFPYQKQVEEFKQKLRLPNHGSVLTEQVRGEKNEAWNSFQFRGVVVERMTVSPTDGKEPVWEEIPIVENWKRLMVELGGPKVVEDEDPRLKDINVVSRGLVMGLPAQFKKGQYPDMTKKLHNLDATLVKLSEEAAKKAIITPKKLLDDSFSPFDVETTKETPLPSAPPDAGEAPKQPIVIDGKNPYVIPGHGEQAQLKETPILHCLIRIVDVSLEGGKTYRYRIKVKMANPNYYPKPTERKDTYPAFAKDKELESDWYEVPQLVVVPPDSQVYAVDQKYVDPRFVSRDDPSRSREVALQIQRWVEEYRPNLAINDTVQVGEWVVDARLFVSRGEYVRARNAKIPIPVKPLNGFEFELDQKSMLDFGDDSILLDFDGGRNLPLEYTRNGGPAKEGEKQESSNVTEKIPTEILVMTHDGRVYARSEAVDAVDSDRVKNYQEYLSRVKEIRKAKSP
jgi:hypothetical protein